MALDLGIRIGVDTSGISGGISAFNQLTNSATLTGRSIQSFTNLMTLAGTAVGVGFGIEAIKNIAQMAERFNMLHTQVRLVSAASSDVTRVFDSIYAASQRTGTSLEGNVTLFQRLARVRDDIGASDQAIVKFVENISKISTVGGSSAAELRNSLIQLSQAIGSGRLNGDELRSVLENNTALAKVLADQFGVGVAQLKSMGEQGKLTGRAVFDAILNATKQINEEFAKAPITMSRGWQEVTNATGEFLSKMDGALGVTQAVAKEFEGIAQFAEGAGKFLDRVLGSTGGRIDTQGIEAKVAQALGAGQINQVIGPTIKSIFAGDQRPNADLRALRSQADDLDAQYAQMAELAKTDKTLNIELLNIDAQRKQVRQQILDIQVAALAAGQHEQEVGAEAIQSQINRQHNLQVEVDKTTQSLKAQTAGLQLQAQAAGGSFEERLAAQARAAGIQAAAQRGVSDELKPLVEQGVSAAERDKLNAQADIAAQNAIRTTKVQIDNQRELAEAYLKGGDAIRQATINTELRTKADEVGAARAKGMTDEITNQVDAQLKLNAAMQLNQTRIQAEAQQRLAGTTAQSSVAMRAAAADAQAYAVALAADQSKGALFNQVLKDQRTALLQIDQAARTVDFKNFLINNNEQAQAQNLVANAPGTGPEAIHQAELAAQAYAKALEDVGRESPNFAKAVNEAYESIRKLDQATRDSNFRKWAEDQGVAIDAAQRLAAAERDGASAVEATNRQLEIEARLRSVGLTPQSDDPRVKQTTDIVNQLGDAKQRGDLNAFTHQQELATQAAKDELSVVTQLPVERAKELAYLKAKADLQEKYKNLPPEELETAAQAAATAAAVKAQAEEISRAREELRAPFVDAAKDVEGSFTDAFQNILEGGSNTFKNLGDAIKNIFIKLAAQIAELMIIKPILAPFEAALGVPGAEGFMMGGGYGGGGGGLLGSLFGGGYGFNPYGAASPGAYNGRPNPVQPYGPGGIPMNAAPATNWGGLIGGFGGLALGTYGAYTAGTQSPTIGSAITGLGTAALGGFSMAQYAPAFQQAATSAFGSSIGGAVGSYAANAGFGMVGSAAGNLVVGAYGGNATGGTIGGLVGGAIGTYILPGVGTLVGSFLGSAIGGLFGGKPSVGPGQAAAVTVNMSGAQVNLHADADNGGNPQAALSQLQPFADQVTKMTDAIRQLGGSFGGDFILHYGENKEKQGFSVNAGGVETDLGTQTSSLAVLQQLIKQEMVKGLDETTMTVIQHTKNPQDLDANLQFAKNYDEFVKTLDGAPTSQLGDKLKNLQSQFSQLSAKATELGLGTDKLQAAYNKQFDQLKQDFLDNLQGAAEGIGHPYKQQLRQIEQNRAGDMRDASLFGIDPAVVNDLYDKQVAKIKQDFLDNLDKQRAQAANPYEAQMVDMRQQEKQDVINAQDLGIDPQQVRDIYTARVKQMQDTLVGDLQAGIQAATDPNAAQMRQLAKQREDYAKQLLALDIPRDLADQWFQAQVDQMKENLSRTLRQGTLQATDPAAAQIEGLQEQRDQYQKQLSTLGMDPGMADQWYNAQAGQLKTNLTNQLQQAILGASDPTAAQLASLAQQKAELIKQALAYGVPTELVHQWYNAQVDAMRNAFTDQLRSVELSLDNSTQGQINQINAEREKALKQALDLGVDQGWVNSVFDKRIGKMRDDFIEQQRQIEQSTESGAQGQIDAVNRERRKALEEAATLGVDEGWINSIYDKQIDKMRQDFIDQMHQVEMSIDNSTQGQIDQINEERGKALEEAATFGVDQGWINSIYDRRIGKMRDDFIEQMRQVEYSTEGQTQGQIDQINAARRKALEQAATLGVDQGWINSIYDRQIQKMRDDFIEQERQVEYSTENQTQGQIDQINSARRKALEQAAALGVDEGWINSIYDRQIQKMRDDFVDQMRQAELQSENQSQAQIEQINMARRKALDEAAALGIDQGWINSIYDRQIQKMRDDFVQQMQLAEINIDNQSAGQIAQINAERRKSLEQAVAFGIDPNWINSIYDRQIQKLRDDFNRNIQTQIAGVWNSAAGQVASMNNEEADLIKQAEGLGADVGAVIYLYAQRLAKMRDDLTKSVAQQLAAIDNEARAQLDQLTNQRDALLQQFAALGMNQDPVYQLYAAQVKQLRDNFTKSIHSELMGFDNPLQGQLDALEEWHRKSIQTATELGTDMVEIERLYGEKRKKIMEDYSDGITASLKSMMASLKQELDSLTYGQQSALSPGDRYNRARAAFDDALNTIQTTGRVPVDINQIINNYLEMSRLNFASSERYAEDYRRATELLSHLTTAQTDSNANISSGSLSEISSSTVSQTGGPISPAGTSLPGSENNSGYYAIVPFTASSANGGAAANDNLAEVVTGLSAIHRVNIDMLTELRGLRDDNAQLTRRMDALFSGLDLAGRRVSAVNF